MSLGTIGLVILPVSVTSPAVATVALQQLTFSTLALRRVGAPTSLVGVGAQSLTLSGLTLSAPTLVAEATSTRTLLGQTSSGLDTD